MRIFLPLPYVFEAPSRHGERAARCASWDDVAVTGPTYIAGADGGTAFVRLPGVGLGSTALPSLLFVRTAFDGDLGLMRASLWLAEEVRDIALSTDCHYLPALSAKLPERDPMPRLDPLLHYLVFRDFGDIGVNPALARALRIPQLAQAHLFEPSFESGLLDIGSDDDGNEWLERGFGYLATRPASGRLELIRFENLQRRATERSTGATRYSPLQRWLYEAALDPHHPARGCARVLQDGILQELVQIPVAPRRFA